jgi:hypothetical protein
VSNVDEVRTAQVVNLRHIKMTAVRVSVVHLILSETVGVAPAVHFYNYRYMTALSYTGRQLAARKTVFHVSMIIIR